MEIDSLGEEKGGFFLTGRLRLRIVNLCFVFWCLIKFLLLFFSTGISVEDVEIGEESAKKKTKAILDLGEEVREYP